MRKYAIGLMWVGALTVSAYLLVALAGLARFGVGPLVVAMVAGVVVGNLCHGWIHPDALPGVRVAQRYLLRAGVALYGFNLGLSQLGAIGARGVWIDLLMVVTTLSVGMLVGRKYLRLDADTAVLVAAGSAFCGAAAVVATVPVLGHRDDEAVADKAAAAVASVVLCGTLAVALYPLLGRQLGVDAEVFGLYVGSTVHEVAQVMAIGSTLGPDGAAAAVVAKMTRVLLLVPFLFGLSAWSNRAGGRQGPIAVPWFALAFVASAGLHSTGWLPVPLERAARLTATAMLTAAMAALGIETTWRRMRAAGRGPFLLGLWLFVELIVVGGAVNLLAARQG